MAVPDNFTFSLQDVVNEIGCAGNMQACVDNADSALYDSAYSSEFGMRKFRNYGKKIEINPESINYYTSGLPYGASGGVVSCGSGGWTVTNVDDYNGIIESYTASGTNGDSCYVTCYESGYWDILSATLEITDTNSEQKAWLNICQDGTSYTC